MRTLKHMSFKGILIKHQIFKTKFEGNVWQLESTNNQILEVKGLRLQEPNHRIYHH